MVLSDVKVDKLPKCNITSCTEDAHYDCPTALGSWGYLCETHYRSHGKAGGNRLVILQKKTVAHLEGVPRINLEYEMDEWGDGTATVTCPACANVHDIETDMRGEMKCHACKQPFFCIPMF